MAFEDLHADGACCGACAHAEEIARTGAPPKPRGRPSLARLDAGGAPIGAGLEIVLRGSAGASFIPIGRGRVVVGRCPPADIVLDHSVLSRRQLAVTFDDLGVHVEDLQSTCGTYVNGISIGYGGATRLCEGDTIEAGDFVISVRC